MFLSTIESADPGGAPFGGRAMPPAVPSDIASEDWDYLFRAVMARLSATAAERPRAALTAQPHDPTGRIPTTVRECVVALNWLHVMQPRPSAERLAL